MWIKELNVQSFGKFQNNKIEFGPEINLIYGENESGKSTLHAFIRGCFFGVKKMRGRAAKMDVYNRYQPWDHPGYFSGMVRFVCGDKVFRLSRDFTKGMTSGELVCESDGELLSLEDGDLEMLLGNIGEVTFDNTVSIGQLRNETDEGLAKELRNHMANYEGSGDLAIKIEQAVSLLKSKKKTLLKEIADRERQEEDKRNALLARLSFIKEEKEKDLAELRKVTAEHRSIKLDEIKEQESGGPRKSLWRRLLDGIKRFFGKLFGRKSKEERDKKQYEAGNTFYGKEKLEGKIEQLEQQIHEKEILIENGYQDLQMMEMLFEDEQVKILKKEVEGCDMAMKRISEVVSQMQMDVGQFLKKRTSEIFSQLTDGKYQFVELKEDMTMLVHGKDRVVLVEQLSRGTIWQLYFALRMAANEVLCKDEDLPVILDDAFAMYDEARLEKTLRWLAKQKKQILIFTCHKREREILNRMGVPYHMVSLGER